jgi:transposase
VESYRNSEGQPRQRVIASLGDAAIPEHEKRLIARMVELRLQNQRDMFDDELSREAASWIDRIVRLVERSKSSRPEGDIEYVDGVKVNEIETENVVEYGPELVGMKAWQALDMSRLLLGIGMNRKAVSTAQMMVINRLIHPLSELALIGWSERTALPECLNIRITKTQKDRLYKTSDQLHKHHSMIEEFLRKKEEQLYGLQRHIVLYDVTNTHFEGICEQNPKARRGRNKQKRNDCPQVAVGLAYDEFGYALAHEVFAGNMSDCKTLETMLDRLEKVCKGPEKPVVILDAGIATKDNLKMLKDRGYAFLVNVTRSSRTKYKELFRAGEFTPLPGREPDEQIEVMSVPDPEDAQQRLVLCRSMKRRQKETAMLSKAEVRFLTDVEALRSRIDKGRIKDQAKIMKAIGGINKKHPRVARFYKLEFQNNGLQITRDDQRIDAATELCGSYVLKTDQTYNAEALWRLYMSLLKAEEGFKLLKGTLGMRPNFHQKEHRVDGHIFISVLAYHLLCWIHNRLEQAGDRRQWKTVRSILRTHCLITTRIPLKDGRVISIRKPNRPDEEQTCIYRSLGIRWEDSYTPRKTEIKA